MYNVLILYSDLDGVEFLPTCNDIWNEDGAWWCFKYIWYKSASARSKLMETRKNMKRTT